MVKQGYKQTEIGVIPEDWEVKTLKNVSPLQRGFDLPYSQMENGVYPVVFSNGIGAYHTKYIAKGPGVITGRSGTIGKVHYVEDNYWPHNTSLWVTNFCNNYPQYIYYLFNSIKWELYNSGSGVPTLNRNDIHDLKCVVPPLAEQVRIAEVLSDVDSMISSLEKLIAKKKAIKQGAMQELLTGKKRLSGFDGEWKIKTINDVAIVMDDHRTPVKESDREKIEGNIPYCGANGILGYVNDYTIDDDIILIAEDGGYFDEYAKRPIAYKMSGKCWVNNHAHIIKSKANTNQDYLFYCLVHKDIRDFITSGTRSKLNKAELLKIVVFLPIDIKEQTVIASILSDMDNEIEVMEQKLAKTRQLKQGMMQQLLTGKIRLL